MLECAPNDFACNLAAGFNLVLPPVAVGLAIFYVTFNKTRAGAALHDPFALDEAPDSEDTELPVDDQDALRSTEATPLIRRSRAAGSQGRTATSVILVAIGFVEVIARLALFLRNGISSHSWAQGPNIVTLIVWLYATVRPLVDPPHTPPYSIFVIYLSNLLGYLVDFYASFWTDTETTVRGWNLLFAIGHPTLCLVGAVLILQMPMQLNSAEPVKDSEGLHPGLDDYATLGQWLTLSWLTPLIEQGKTAPLEEDDVWQLARGFRSRFLLRVFERVAPESNFMVRLLKAHARDILAMGVLSIVSVVLSVAQPMILSQILRAMTPEEGLLASLASVPVIRNLPFVAPVNADKTSDRKSAYLWVALAFLVQLMRAVSDIQKLYLARRVTLCARSEATASIYQKTLRRIDTSGLVGVRTKKSEDGEEQQAAASEPDSSADVGKITNLVSSDTVRINSFVNFWLMATQTPISVFLTASFMYRLMGWSAFAGYVTLVVAMPLNSYLMKWEYNAMQGALKARDARMTSMNELVQSIKYIKLSAWETKWSQRVLQQRDLELAQLRKHKWARFGIGIVWDLVPIFVACISLTCFTLVEKRELSVSIAFPALLTFQMLSEDLTSIPLFVNIAQRVYASVMRVSDYLDEQEVPAHVSSLSRTERSPLDFDERVGCESATFVWNSTAIRPDKVLAEELLNRAEEQKQANRRSWVQMLTLRKRPTVLPETASDTTATVAATPSTPKQEFALRNLSVIFPRGKMSLICGNTGAGKSSLLSALLGEMKCLDGRVFLPKFPTHVDHETGLKEGISFCAQHPWLQHQTIRENILFGTPYDDKRYNDVLGACALVQDLEMFDDGDGTEIGEKGITLSGGQKARVALARAVYAYTKTVLLDDVLSAVDTHTAEVLIQRCFLGPLMQGRTLILVTHHVESVLNHCAYVVRLQNGSIEAQGTVEELRSSGHLAALQASTAPEPSPEAETPAGDVVRSEEAAEDPKAAKKLVETEAKAIGSVKIRIYLTYISAAGYWIVGLLALALIIQRCSDLGQRLWVKTWSESYDNASAFHVEPKANLSFGFPSASQNVLPYIAVYTGIQFIAALGWLAIQLPEVLGSLRASRIIFQRMLESVIRAPVRWFDITPSGRVLNRFSKDIDGVDEGLGQFYSGVLFNIVTLTVSMSIMAYGVPQFLIVAVLLGYLHYYVAEGFIITSRDLNRLENTFRSPLISAFGELLLGVATVRAFTEERRFMSILFKRLDRTQAAGYYNNMTNYWLRLRFSFLSALTFVSTAILALSAGLSAGLTAIVITQAQSLYNTMYWGMFSYVEAEQAFNSIERISEYIELAPEPPRITDKRPAQNWPSQKGGIEFDNVVIKYAADLEPVLKNVSFKIAAREKIGLVGRTGSGKSTMALSLFRFVDPAQGKIVIDGVDITSIGVEDLRSRLTLIPQDAVLFKGSIRENLDPFNEYTDADCLDVLRAVQLPVDELETSAVPSPNATIASGYSNPRVDAGKIIVTLESQVSEGGNNWSAGQRQLIAMARALLRKTRVIVLDESTASVDFETDKKIQHAIREGFRDGIMLIIAHRLHTIIECDRIIVLDAGQVTEFDTPGNLIEKEGGVFRGMCEKSDGFAALRAAAQRKPVGG